jgi:acetylglutamate kinase
MNKIKIVKVGGNIINNPEALSLFLSNFAQLEGAKILVHGGGKLATRVAESMNLEVKMVDGRRITDQESLDVVTMVYSGKINTSVVAELNSLNCTSVGFSGADGNCIQAIKRPVLDIDYGFVGDITGINTNILEVLINNKMTPVFSAITSTKEGQLLNTNADTIASEIAIGLSKKYEVELYYCFEKNGVLENVNNNNSTIEHISPSKFENLVEQKVIFEGMLPKLKNCIHAIENNVSKVCLGKENMLYSSKAKYTTISK